MSYQLEIKIEDEHFYEDNGSPQPCEEVDTFEQYLEFLVILKISYLVILYIVEC